VIHILLVEDHLGTQLALALLLEMDGFHVRSVASGEAALVALDDPLPCDVVLLDLNTGDLSAADFVECLDERYRDSSARPYVGVVSGSAHIESESREIGADFWIGKPYEPSELIRKINFALAGAPSRRSRPDISGEARQ